MDNKMSFNEISSIENKEGIMKIHPINSFVVENEKDKRREFFLKQKTIITNIKQFYWPKKRCLLKIKDKSQPRIYLGQKAKVLVNDGTKLFSRLKINNTRILLKLSQSNLQSTIPKNSGCIIILSGMFKNKKGLLHGIDKNTFTGIIQIKEFKLLIRVPFEWFT